MGPIRPILIALLLCGSCIAQTITPTKVNVTSGYTNPRVVGQYLLHGDFSSPVSRPGVLLTIDGLASGQKLFEIFAVQSTSVDNVGDVQALSDGSYLLVGDGRYFISATFENPTAVKRFSVELSPPTPPKPPDPPKPPTPDVPPDMFDNIGQRVALWAAGLPRRNEVAKLYSDCATAIKGLTSVNIEVDKMVKARTALLKPDELAKYQPLLDQLNADIRKRSPMAQLLTAQYFEAVAAGLAGAK